MTTPARPAAEGDGAAPIPLARPAVGPREEELVVATLRSGQLSLGPRLGDFELAFADRLGVGHASAVSSGTAGLHLALRAAGVEAGDEVVTTPLSFVASANAIVYEGARPVFCDIDRRTLNLDPDAAAAAVGPGTRGLLPVHIFGYPADLPAFERLAGEHGLFVVEDACEALGAQHADGPLVGARGNLAVFGFYPNKQLTTGEGGMVVSSQASVKARIDSERNQGRAPDMSWLDHDRLGYNYRLSELACALGVAQLERLDDLLADRRSLAAAYSEQLSAPDRPPALDGIELPCPDAGGDRRSPFAYVVQLPAGADRDAAIAALRARGIDSKPYLPAIHLMSFYRERFGHREGELPVCEDVARRSLALPFFPGLTQAETDRVCTALAEALAVRSA
ncbi:MAG TPA: DegT/DnrJ/EryC1/StrS family aminotransferase [Thermoleophilaceae bacterium]|nr:DegT/DnrJ/EryC1/StrS family aminotransferase [Thermoleophilaceae bacterium]